MWGQQLTARGLHLPVIVVAIHEAVVPKKLQLLRLDSMPVLLYQKGLGLEDNSPVHFDVEKAVLVVRALYHERPAATAVVVCHWWLLTDFVPSSP